MAEYETLFASDDISGKMVEITIFNRLNAVVSKGA